jgi:predicted component of type VI protein secretion system
MDHPPATRPAGVPAVTPYLTYRDQDDQELRVPLDGAAGRLSLGRAAACDVPLAWDLEISRVHAELEPVGQDWALVDDGLSRNGTFVNGERLSGRRRLQHGDHLRLGGTALVYHAPRPPEQPTAVAAGLSSELKLSDAQRRVLVALCRPFKHGRAYATPATNQQIADELFLSVDAVKTHLRVLFHKLAVEDLPQNQKRAKLVERAFAAGLVAERDL